MDVNGPAGQSALNESEISPTLQSPALVFDITTLSQRANLRPTGIDRIQLEIASVLADQGSPRVAFCTYNSKHQRFERVSQATVRELATRMRGASAVARERPDSSRRSRRETRTLRLGLSIVRGLAGQFPSARPHLHRAASHTWRAVGELRRAFQGLGTDIAARRSKRNQDSARCFASEWSSSTTYCSLGMDWLHNDLGLLSERKSQIGFRVALMVHDLIPEVTPQFAGAAATDYFLDVLRIADTALLYSDATLQDLRAFATAHGFETPTVVKLPLGSVLHDLVPVGPEPSPEGIEILEGRYILCVGTITIRKNHQLLFDVWERLIASCDADDLPMLIVAGTRGWLSDETMSRLERTPSFKGVVLHISDATDENIAWLYKHCAFTVYPSLYEGWGLPVSESHDFGKVCLTTDRSSLPEAGEGLAELLDPYDRGLWLERIVHFWSNREALAEREHKIRQNHVRITARQSADVVLHTAGLPRCR